jgi:hypothetical protein
VVLVRSAASASSAFFSFASAAPAVGACLDSVVSFFGLARTGSAWVPLLRAGQVDSFAFLRAATLDLSSSHWFALESTCSATGPGSAAGESAIAAPRCPFSGDRRFVPSGSQLSAWLALSGRAFPMGSSVPLEVVRLAGKDLGGAEELLEQSHPGELMRHRLRAQ